MYWGLETSPLELRHHGEGDRNKALHVARATAIEFAVTLSHRKRIRGPWLPIHWHDVSVSGEHDAAGSFRSNSCVEISLLALFVIDAQMRDAPAVEIILDEFNQRDVAITACRIEGDQLFEHVAR